MPSPGVRFSGILQTFSWGPHWPSSLHLTCLLLSYHAFQTLLPLTGTSFLRGNPLPLLSRSHVNVFQIATRMSPTCDLWRSNLPSRSLGDSTCAGPRCRTPFSVRAVFSPCNAFCLLLTHMIMQRVVKQDACAYAGRFHCRRQITSRSYVDAVTCS